MSGPSPKDFPSEAKVRSMDDQHRIAIVRDQLAEIWFHHNERDGSRKPLIKDCRVRAGSLFIEDKGGALFRVSFERLGG